MNKIVNLEDIDILVAKSFQTLYSEYEKLHEKRIPSTFLEKFN